MAATTETKGTELTTPSVAVAGEQRSTDPLAIASTKAEGVIDLGESGPAAPDADLWLEYGRKMVNDGPASIRSAASALMTGLGALQGVYLGILGFAEFITKNIDLALKFLFVTPPLLWMVALYHCLKVMMTSLTEMNLNAPSDIREKYAEMVKEKQHLLEVAFWFLLGGLTAAILLVIFRLKM